MANFLSPIGNSQFVDVNGNPLTGGKVYTYLADSSTPAATYTTVDRGGVIVQQSNPIILNSLGLPTNPIWLLGGASYKFVVKDSAEVTMETIDYITGVNDSTVTATPDQWVVSGFTPTYLAPTVFSVVGDRTTILTVGRRIKTNNTALVIYSYIISSVFSGSVTTVTVVNDASTLDTGLNLLYYSFLSADYPSLPNSIAARASMGASATGEAVFISATKAAARTAMDASSIYYLQARDEKANTTAAGASVAGDQTRTLNTMVSNTITGASLSANQITLPAGTYRVRAHAPAFNVGTHQLRLSNITDGTDVIRGTNEYTFAAVQSRSVVEGRFTLAATKALSLKHYTNLVVAGNGLGVQISIGAIENYTTIEIWQE